MYRLIEITKQNDKESQAIYDYELEIDAKGDYESKLGANLKSDAYSAFTLMIIDNTGIIVDSYHKGDELSPRLIEVKTTDTDAKDMAKYDSVDLVIANFHSKWGAAIKDNSVRAEMLLGIDGNGGTVAYTYWVRPITPTE